MTINNDNNGFECQICYRQFKKLYSLSTHIKSHGITSKQYYDKYLKSLGEGKCLCCDNETTFRGLNGYSTYCGTHCAQNSFLTKEKKKETFIKNYGVSNVFKSDKFLEDQINRNKKIKDKRIEDRNLIVCEICGFESPSLYGLSKHVNRSHDIPLEVYYDKYLLKTESEKFCKICGEKTRFYGFSQGYRKYCSTKCVWSDSEIERNRKNTCLSKYGVNHPQKTDKSRENTRNRMINQIEKQRFHGEPLCPHIGVNERKCLDTIELEIGVPILRNEKLIGFYPDGRIENTNVLIEFDEPFHYYTDNSLKQRDIDRQKQLENRGYKVFRISQTDWDENKEKVMKEFFKYVEEHIGDEILDERK